MEHIPTGVTVTVDGRSRRHNLKRALELMDDRLRKHREGQEAQKKKARRDEKIKGEQRIRTYDYSRGVVTDHRSGKTASIKDIIIKGLLDKLK